MKNKEIHELIEWDREHLIHPICPIGENAAFIIDKAEGIVFKDIEGNEYLDASSQLVCLNLGYGRKDIVEAIEGQLAKFSYFHQYWGMSNTTTIKCAQKLAEITPEGLDHFMFTSGGSESNEVAFRIARRYWNSKGSNKHKIISLYDSYHGISFGAMSATGLGKGSLWKGAGPLVPGFLRIPSYYCYRCAFGKEYPECDIQCAQHLAFVIEREGPETVAAFIAEPAQGSSGHIIPPPEYWPKIRDVCKEYDIILIADEVITGFCRTGKMFALEHWDVKPDIMTMAKGITGAYFPFGAVAFNDQIHEVLKGQFFAGYTYSGQPTGAAAATKAIEIYLDENVADNASKVGKYALDRLNTEFKSLPCVGDIDGLGLMIGIEIVTDKATKRPFGPEAEILKRIQDETFRRGAFIRVSSISDGPGDRCAFCPPLITTIEQADKILDILYPVLDGLKPN